MERSTAWLDKPLSAALRLDWEKALYALIFVLALVSRLWDLGARGMSHDESLHTYYAWELYHGQGFHTNPLYHGPLRFHLTALIYALFGASDYTSRLGPALLGVALVMSPILLRPWLGRRGALLASIFILISPSILYHARYIRDETFMLLYSVLAVWVTLSYFRDRSPKWLLALATIMGLMYTTMETAFIYVFIFGVFVVAVMLIEIARDAGWGRAGVAGTALGVGAMLAVFGAGILIGALVLHLLQPAIPTDGSPIPFTQLLPSLTWIVAVGGLIGVGAFFALKSLVPDSARRSAGFNLAIVLGGLSLFMLSSAALLPLNFHFGTQYEVVEGVTQAIPDSGNTVWGLLSGETNAAYFSPSLFESGVFPVDAANTIFLVRLLFLFVCFAGLALGLGLWWDVRRWLIALGIFGGIGVTLFTTIFTNGVGLGVGFVGSLLYWLAQQEVNRGTQPTGYYFIVTPIYEYLPIILALIALGYFGWKWLTRRSTAPNGDRAVGAELLAPLLALWVLLSWTIYTIAGEKMPWLMTHLALPMILLGARLVGGWFDGVDWRAALARREWLAALLVPIFIAGSLAVIGAIGALGAAAQQGASAPSLESLNASGSLLSGLLVAGGALIGLRLVAKRGSARAIVHMAALAGLVALSLLTLRTAWMFSFVNYDYAIEFGVYAHGGPGLKLAMQQIEGLSQQLTGAPNQIELLYDEGWPWLWYLRDFPNKRYVTGTPSRSDASLPIMILSEHNWQAVDQSVGSNYNWFQFHRIWWPMEDYKNLTGVLCPVQVQQPDGSFTRYAAYDENGDGAIDASEQASGDARCRQRALQLIPALWDIFFQRDYTKYAQLTGETLTLQHWPLQSDFRLYIRKDLAAKVWNQAIGSIAAGGSETPGASIDDPYQARWQDVTSLQTFGSAGVEAGQLQSPHGIAVAPGGSVYVADSLNHRIVKFKDGEFVAQFGAWSGQPPNNDPFSPNWNPPAGTFSEPWDVAAGPDGSVYVADTWNGRIQKFDANGKFVKMWGWLGDSGGQAAGKEGEFYGPRGIAVGQDGRVYVADTGNKRVQVFDADGEFITQFGGGGLLDGNLDEPVGIAVNGQGEVVVADTWNGRIQVFSADGQLLRKWDITGWFDPSAPDLGQARVGKPYLTAGPDGRIYVADQAATRILVFSPAGEYRSSFGQFGVDDRGFTTPSGVAIDRQGNVLVVDTGNGRVMVFPPVTAEPEQ
jgi:DNA-binding beta-propeller fold protein YncE